MFNTAKRVITSFADNVFLKLALKYLSVLKEHSAVAVVTGITARMIRSL
jgi:hypothetical protein